MDFKALEAEVKGQGIKTLRDEPMRGHTSFRIGGPAALMILPRNEEELIRAVKTLRASGTEPFVMGNGTNLLVTDEPLNRVVLKTFDGLAEIQKVGDRCLRVGAGALLSRTATAARDAGLSGFEFAHGIPGTLGGAVVMNAGAYGGEMSQVIQSVTFLDTLGETQTLSLADLELGYRRSRFAGSGEIVLSATLVLTPGNPDIIQERMNALSAKRRASQPLNLPSAGSTFKRPETGYAAALIQEAGLKGYQVGGAQVSEKHAGFVVNRGGATFADVRAVMAHVQEEVLRQSGVLLEPEVRVIEERE